MKWGDFPTRFADLPRWAALTVLAALLALLAVASWSPARSPAPKVRTTSEQHSDLQLYRDVIAGVAAGGHYYEVAAQELRQVREADVVVTNPTELAVAIKYDAQTMDAPIVVAKGAGELAARIRQIAAEHRVPIVEKKPLAQALYKHIRPGQAIPVDLYEAVAEILAYVYRLSGKTTAAV